MGAGLVAYQFPLGKHADRKDLVPIFDDKDEILFLQKTGSFL